MPKATTPSSGERRHVPLADDLLATGHLRTKSSKRKSRSDENDEDHYIDAKTSRKILQIGQDLADEDAAHTRTDSTDEIETNAAFNFDSRFTAEEESDDEDAQKYGDDEWGDEVEEVEEVV